MAQVYYPIPDRSSLTTQYVGKPLEDVPVPAIILDVAKVKRNCKLMLDAVEELGVEFRAHVKTHKTLELTRLQLGDYSKDVRLIGSTLAELEALLPLMKSYQQEGAKTNVLYGVPVGPSHIQRLASFLQNAGPGSLSLMIDHPTQLTTVQRIYDLTDSMQVQVYLKTDSGYHRAGLPPASNRMQQLVKATLELEARGILLLLGFYSHNSNSYSGNSPSDAMDHLRAEVDACTEAALRNTPEGYVDSRKEPLAISCGASPTALSLQNLLNNSTDTAKTPAAKALKSSLAEAGESNIHFEIHAGVYPTFDMQQVSAMSRDLGDRPEDNIAISVLAEVCSTYPDRTEIPEALVSAGGIALAREPCKSYRGHGVITGWLMPDGYNPYDMKNRIIVDRISQEHGLLQWEDRNVTKELPLEYGQRLQIWPNHACITGSQYGWYFVIDSDSDDANIVRDIWMRIRGW